MVKRAGAAQRRAVFLILLVVILLGFAVLLFFLWPRQKSYIETAVIDGDPLRIVSLQKETNTLVVISIPAQFSVDVPRGHGIYPISSLWELGVQEGVEGDILRESVAYLLGTPITWYVKNSATGNSDFFELGHVPSIFSGSRKTNMSPIQYGSLAWQVGEVTSDRVVEITIPEAIVVPEVLPDGSTRRVLTPRIVDTVITDQLESLAVRKEALTIYIANTTTIPGRAEDFARRVSKLGGNVVRTGNEEISLEGCLVQGSQEVLKTNTVQQIQLLFGCLVEEAQVDSYADITILVGE